MVFLVVLSLLRLFLRHVLNPGCPLIRRSNAFKYSLDFDFWYGFCSSMLGITIIALNAMFFKMIKSKEKIL